MVVLALSSHYIKQKYMKALSKMRVSSTPLNERIDWTAVEHLQKKREKSSDPYQIEAIENAIDSALKAPIRLSKAKVLCEDLFRDGKRKASQRYNANSKICVSVHQFLIDNEELEDVSIATSSNIKSALKIIKEAFATLKDKEILALYLKISNKSTPFNIKEVLNVGYKQYTNLLNSGKIKLNQIASFNEAFFIVLINCEEHELIKIITRLIKINLKELKNAA